MAGVNNPYLQGDYIISESFSGLALNCSGPQPVWSALVSPDTTTTYIVSWTETKRENYASCGLWDRLYVWNFVDTVTIVVELAVIPEFTIDKTKVHCGEQFSINFNNCDRDGIEPDYYYQIQDQCGNINVFSLCSNSGTSSYTFIAPDYLTTFNLRAKFIRTDPWFCESDWSDFKQVEVVEIPNPNACNDPVIQEIESQLSDSSMIVSNSSYHDYSVENSLCNSTYSGQYECSMNSAWSFLKSNVSNQAPQLEDFPSTRHSPLSMIANLVAPAILPPPNNPISNCQSMALPSTCERTMFALILKIYGFGANVFGYQTQPVEIASDPIKVVIDDGCKCITNYTMPGHILYPGKVRRCLYLDGCGDIKIKTTGTGYHFFGDNGAGIIMGGVNKLVGSYTFNWVDYRFIQYFNQ